MIRGTRLNLPSLSGAGFRNPLPAAAPEITGTLQTVPLAWKKARVPRSLRPATTTGNGRKLQSEEPLGALSSKVKEYPITDGLFASAAAKASSFGWLPEGFPEGLP